MKWLGIGLAVLVAVVAVALIGARVVSGNKLAKTWEVRDLPVPTLPTDEAAIAEGGRLFFARGCAECHGADGAGKVVVDDPVLGKVVGANITRGKGGLPPTFGDEDMVRVFKHCVRPDGTSIKIMPCEETMLIPDREIGAMIAWMKTLPPVDREVETVALSLTGHALHGFGVIPLVSPEKLDFDAAIPPAPEPGPTAAWGERLAQIQCVGCHGAGFSGGPMPGMPPTMPVPTNITPDEATGIGKWKKEQFVHLLKTGKRPDGTDVNPFMPWSVYKNLNEMEMDAIWAYLRERPAKPFGNR